MFGSVNIRPVKTFKGARFPCSAAKKLHALIIRRGLTSAAAGKEIHRVKGGNGHYSRGTVHAWRHEQARPELEAKVDIALWSREQDAATGEWGPPSITVDDWLLDRERWALQAVQAMQGAS